MKKLIVLFIAFLIMLSSTSQMAFAEDVWVGNDMGKDLYIISDTITYPNDDAVKVAVKYVKNRKLEKVDLWSFGRFKGEWRYSTDMMRQRGRTDRVNWNDFTGRILSYCLEHRN